MKNINNDKIINETVETYLKGFSCSQAILSAFSTQFDLDKEIALKLATAFGGGIGRMGKTCGAVTGALMVIGLKYGRIKIEDLEAKERVYDLVDQFVKKFIILNGSIECKELLGCDISIPDGRQVALEKNFFKEICPKFVRDAAQILNQII